MNLWRMIVHHSLPTDALDWVRRNNRIAVGWGNIGDLRVLNFRSGGEIGSAIRQVYPQLRNSGMGGPSLLNFYQEMKQGDLVILGTGLKRVLVVRVESSYKYETGNIMGLGDYYHQREISLTNLNPDEVWDQAGAAVAPGQSIRWTVVRCN